MEKIHGEKKSYRPREKYEEKSNMVIMNIQLQMLLI